jgi:release factor glutamine methyltransferase
MEQQSTWQQIRKALFEIPLAPYYEADERKAMWQWWCESRLGISLNQQSSWQYGLADAAAVAMLESDLARLMAGEPFQYVLNEAWFLGKRYVLNSNVLIPRPETEELVRWMLEVLEPESSWRIADMGSGSGIIPISLQLARRHWQLWGADLSAEALATAKQNAQLHQVAVSWLEGDMCSLQLPEIDVLVSNPPYIPLDEAHTLHPRVSQHEPAMALFSPQTDALFFYRCLAERFKQMGSGKQLFLELNDEKATEIGGLFDGYEVTYRADMQGKNRMLRVQS